MDLVAGVKRIVIIMMTHCQQGPGESKLLKECTLPLTGAGVVDEIITELGVFAVTQEGLKVVELAPDVTMDEVRDKTEATLVG